MKRTLALLALLFLASPLRGDSAGVSLVCLSIQIDPATIRNFGLDTTLSVSTTGRTTNPNGELGLADQTIPFSHSSYFILDDVTFPEPVSFIFGLDVPDQADANTNGLADFFDVTMETAGERTSGVYATPDGQGEDFTATWSRPAGQSTGHVVLDLPSLGQFTHQYRILQYDGRVTYSVSNKTVSGTVALTNLLAADDQISGPVLMTITNNSQLGYDSGIWSGSGGASFTFHSIDSLDQAGTNYIALLGLEDGYPATADQDYNYWILVIHSADANGNGVLDLVESREAADEPRLEIRKAEPGIELTIHVSRGASYILEGTDSLTPPDWSNVQGVTLNDSTQIVALGLPGHKRFFRLHESSTSGVTR